MIEFEKIDEYCTRVVIIVNEMRNHGDTISNQQVMEKILISVTEKYEYIVAITEKTKDLSKLSIKELVGSFRAHEKRIFFREDQPKETTFQSRTNENSQKFSKNQQKKNYIQKRSRIMMILLRRLKKMVRKVLVFFIKFAKD